ncbi:MAG: hypothetical protein CVT94_07790 [Bacteroidetes bacterium HGW-Bacteroidetes-11]|jgi:hypothetical protein|nr:MAG: hypothetical protein CVT94_07790 [Bacteroidetes bacterium HGW-Bacteroidetes-11]
MKTKIFIIVLTAIVISSCSSPGYLPSSDKIDVNEYGSYIKLTQNNKSIIDGELIAIDSNQIVVLTDKEKICITVPVGEVKKFSLEYAKPKHYGWSIPVGFLLPFIHGWYSIFTIPIHLIVTISVTASGENAFKYNNKKMTYEELKMFARFPQGIPPDIDLANVK